MALRGGYFANKLTEENLKKAIEYYEKAIEKDPEYAPAYVGLAGCYSALPYFGTLPTGEAYPKAKEEVLKALEIDKTLPEAHNMLGWIRTNEWDWENAEREYKRAIELNPGLAEAHHGYSLHLQYMARFEETFEEIKRARELDPLSSHKQ